MMNKDNKTVRACPRCGKDMDFSMNSYRPFCSKRCKMADLGSWLKEEYYIASSIFDIELEQRSKQQGAGN